MLLSLILNIYLIIEVRVGDCNENAMRMFSECGLIFSEVELGWNRFCMVLINDIFCPLFADSFLPL